MNVWLFAETATSLNPYLFTEIKQSVDESRRDTGKAESIAKRKCRGQEERRVSFVFFKVNCKIGLEDSRNVIFGSEAIVRCIRLDRKVRCEEYVVVIYDGSNDPKEKSKPSENVGYLKK